jgi:hypothetical protein
MDSTQQNDGRSKQILPILVLQSPEKSLHPNMSNYLNFKGFLFWRWTTV